VKISMNPLIDVFCQQRIAIVLGIGVFRQTFKVILLQEWREEKNGRRKTVQLKNP